MHRTAIILACFFICTTSTAQQYPFVHYTPKDGLVNSRVRKAYQDSKGRMYFLTYGGLSVFDGARFRNYTTKNGLAASLVNDILEVGNDSLLVASNNGLYLNVLVNGQMKIVNMQSNCPVINQFYRHSNGKIYLAADNGLFELGKNDFHELDISSLKEKSQNLPYLEAITGYGNWLVFTVAETRFLRGIFLYDISKDRICDSFSFSGTLFNKDPKGRSWFSIGNNLFILDTAALVKGKLLLISPPGGFVRIKNYSIVRMTFTEDLAWYIYRDKEYRSIELRSIDETGPKSELPLPAEVRSSVIQHIYVDRENNVWLSNDGEGVFKLVHSPLQVLELPNTRSKKISVHHSFHDGQTTWFSTGDQVIFRLSGNNFEEFKTNMKGMVLFHNNGKQLLGYDATTLYEGNIQFQRRSITFKPILTLSNDLFGQLLVDRYENVIAIQESGLAVWKKGKRLFHLPIRTKEDLSDNITFDKQGRLWSINRYSGIDVFSLHPENEQEYLKSELHFPKDVVSGSPRSLVIDQAAQVWIGTRDDGLSVYSQEGDKLIKKFHFHTGNGLTDNFVNELACDSLNNIIAGTQTGIDRIVPDITGSYHVENLSRSRNHFAFIREVWATGSYAYALSLPGQVFQISPASKNEVIKSPTLFLEELKLNSKVADPEKTVFHHKENNITFLLAAPSFVDEKQVKFSYLLEGSGNDIWSDTSSVNSTINLTNLSSGKYQLRVKAFFPSISYPPSEYSYSFEITPPWWQTWWFRISAGIVIIGLLIIAIRFYYRRKLEKEKAVIERQQAIEKERTRIATDMHDDLGAGLSRIKFITQSMNKKLQAEPARAELEKITVLSDEMSEKMGEIIWALNERNDSVADLIAFTRAYAVEYLSNHHINCDAETPLQLPDHFIPGEVRRNIFLAVKECLHNIVKHAEATEVRFIIRLNKEMTIIIHDNGKGIDWENKRAFSNGIQNIRRRMEDIHGQVNFSNEQGTQVQMTIRL